MATASKYLAHAPDSQGKTHYTPAEHAVWRKLSAAQRPLLPGRACDEFIVGLDRLQLPTRRIPQCAAVSQRLELATGWRVAPVPALIGFDEFFGMLASRVFPAASFIRALEEFEYLQEPDIFHEIFGHTPLLTEPMFADFSQHIGEVGQAAGPQYHIWLARLYWMTIEFGLINTRYGLRAYGAGIISSNTELVYALESDVPQRRPFDVLDALRTPYRIDRLQPVYYVLDSFRQLVELTTSNLLDLIDEARERGMFVSPLSKESKNDRHDLRPVQPAL